MLEQEKALGLISRPLSNVFESAGLETAQNLCLGFTVKNCAVMINTTPSCHTMYSSAVLFFPFLFFSLISLGLFSYLSGN